MEEPTIFGFTWEQIKGAQQGQPLRSKVEHTTPKEANESDKALLVEHGAAGLEERMLYGVIDRLRTSKLI